MIIKIYGRPISKKNSKRVIWNKQRRRYFIIPSKPYLDFEKDAGVQLMGQYKGDPIATDVKIDYEFFFKGKLTCDVDNAIASINDILQKFRVIADDDQVMQGSFIKTRGCNEWMTTIYIEQV